MRKPLCEALEAARQIGDEHHWAMALSAVAGRLGPQEREKTLREALEAARQIGDEYHRAMALSTVAARLGSKERGKALRAALDVARGVGNGGPRAIALSAVAARFGPEERELLREALEAARQIENEASRAGVVSVVADRLAPEERELLREALEAARTIGNDNCRAMALSAVAEKADLRTFSAGAESFLAVIGDQRADGILRSAARLWTELGHYPNASRLNEFGSWLSRLSRCGRPRLVRALSILLPVIEDLGGQKVLAETAQAIIDAGKWWP